MCLLEKICLIGEVCSGMSSSSIGHCICVYHEYVYEIRCIRWENSHQGDIWICWWECGLGHSGALCSLGVVDPCSPAQ